MTLPRLLIVSEAAVAPEAQGASRTLHELFAGYPGPLRIVSSSPGPRDGLDRIRIPRRIVPEHINHLGEATTAARGRADSWLLRHGPWVRRAVATFHPEVVLACPLSPWGVATATGVVRVAGVPLVTYFMDDWAAAGDQRVATLLRNSARWLMISDQLRDLVVERWALTAPASLVVHNPARASSQPRRDRAARGIAGGCRIVYAGSIWPMHADALVLTAEAVSLLRARGQDCELVVHTAPDFVRRHRSLFERDGVVDGGLRDPVRLREDLLEADLALLACSFAEDQLAMSRSSLQTKLTDYMSAGAPILGVGPAGAASIRFVEQWDVGRCCTTTDPSELAGVIGGFAGSSELKRIAERARRVVREHFDADEVRDRVWRFVAAASHDSRPATQPV